jgi:fatty-acyl-CoA synthase
LKTLAQYARPIFLRLSPRIEVTGTFKQRKVDLVREGFDPSTIADPLYVLDPAGDKYVQLTTNQFEDILAGRIRF